ncbi:MAG: NAD kinase [Flavobacteriales bacterium]|nr:NAD kinase [Flavobacteriales bacterium]|tara:strand:- start:214 stop:1113 length:900 start_codon:yes stop_codon:yes gene_type:complete
MNLLLHGKKFSKNIGEQIINFIDELILANHDINCTTSFFQLIEKRTSKYNNKLINTINSIDKNHSNIDYIICFGGDGTILDAATLVKNTEIPIIGINTGRLGFLATISKNDISTLMNYLINKKYNLSNRTLLEIQAEKTKLAFPFALNEISVSSKENSSMINVQVFLNNEYLNTYWADGLIISTPTGSTGYSLSCGGPIVMPKSNNFIITPIAPHNLNVRPLVVSDDNVIRLKIIDNNNSRKFLLSMDSRNEYVKKGTSITIKKANYNIKLLELLSATYSQTIREKLLWGLDTRNHELL